MEAKEIQVILFQLTKVIGESFPIIWKIIWIKDFCKNAGSQSLGLLIICPTSWCPSCHSFCYPAANWMIVNSTHSLSGMYLSVFIASATKELVYLKSCPEKVTCSSWILFLCVKGVNPRGLNELSILFDWPGGFSKPISPWPKVTFTIVSDG